MKERLTEIIFSIFAVGVITLVMWSFIRPTHEDMVMIKDKPLSEYPHFRIVEIVYDIDTDGDGEYDSQYRWVRELE